ncbi:unnamed protein product, partial [Tetraodon nigroviridis]
KSKRLLVELGGPGRRNPRWPRSFGNPGQGCSPCSTAAAKSASPSSLWSGRRRRAEAAPGTSPSDPRSFFSPQHATRSASTPGCSGAATWDTVSKVSRSGTSFCGGLQPLPGVSITTSLSLPF